MEDNNKELEKMNIEFAKLLQEFSIRGKQVLRTFEKLEEAREKEEPKEAKNNQTVITTPSFK